MVKAVRKFARLEAENEYGGLNRKSPIGSHIQMLGHRKQHSWEMCGLVGGSMGGL